MDIVDKYVIKGDDSDAQKAIRRFDSSVRASTDKFKAAAYEQKTAMERLQAALGEWGVKVASVGAAYVLFKGVMLDGIKSNIEYQRTTELLRRALADSGHEVESNTAAIQALAGAQEIQTGVSDEVTRGLYAMALNMGVGVEKTQAMVEAAIRLNKAYGIDLNSAMTNLGKTLSGQKGELAERIAQIRDLTDEELKSGKAIDIINQSLESNLELAPTFGDSIIRLGNAFSSFSEALFKAATGGETLGSVIGSVAGFIEGVNTAIEGRPMAALLQVMAGAGGMVPGLQAIGLAASFVAGTKDPAAAVPGMVGKAPGDSGFDFAGSPDLGLGVRTVSARAASSRAAAASRFGGAGGVSMSGAPIGYGESFGGGTAGDAVSNAERQAEELRKSIEDQVGAFKAFSEKVQGSLTDFYESESAKRSEILRKEAQEQEDIQMLMIGRAEDGVQAFASLAIESIKALSTGSVAAFEEVLKSFLVSTGQQLIARSINDGFAGTSLLIQTQGSSPQGYALVALAAAEASAGTAMLAGGIAWQSATPGGNAAGGGGMAGGGVGGAGGGGGALDQREDRSEHVTVQVFTVGDIGPAEARKISAAINDAQRRGL